MALGASLGGVPQTIGLRNSCLQQQAKTSLVCRVNYT
ncbi:hypothetical protein RSAG8_05805, partial [Rhizoctonia solani AG-8 WAC10335]